VCGDLGCVVIWGTVVWVMPVWQQIAWGGGRGGKWLPGNAR
jgi:hypothetical protein